MIKRILFLVMLCVISFAAVYGQGNDTMERAAVVDIDKIRASGQANIENRIGNIALGAGFAIVLNKNNPVVLWNNELVDITDSVINSARHQTIMSRLALVDSERVVQLSISIHLEQLRAVYALELQRRQEEIQELYEEARRQDDQAQKNRIYEEIKKKADELVKYMEEKEAEIRVEIRKVQVVRESIRNAIAEPARTAGYGVALDLKNPIIVWRQLFIDISDRVINNVRSAPADSNTMRKIAVVDRNRVNNYIEQNKVRPSEDNDSRGKFIHDTIGSIWNEVGFAVVLNSNNPAILWYLGSIDITDRVINKIRSNQR